MSEMIYSKALNKSIRKGKWTQQLVSTYEKICTAIKDGLTDDASELVLYFLEEARICYDIYAHWSSQFIRFIEDQPGVIHGEIEGVKSDLLKLVGDNGKSLEPKSRWTTLHARKAGLLRGIHGQASTSELLEQMEQLRIYWQNLHDAYVDYCSGLLTYIAARFGEDNVETAYRDYAIGQLFDERYKLFSPENDWDQVFEHLVYLSIESMRAHLCGPNRFGEMDMTEDEEKVVFAFDPCGSGGRTTRTRIEEPYYFGVTKEEYPWAWNQKGVCYYCAHCSVVLENIPMEKWGYPTRVVEPPTYPDRKDAKCRWTIYKDPNNIPDEVWERHSMTRPAKNTDASKGEKETK